MIQNVKGVENIFLSVLRADSDRDHINKEIQHFTACDWDKLYEFAIQSGLFPVFYNCLLSLDLNNISADFLSRLKNLYFLNLRRNILLEQELFRIISYFKGLNIPVMPLKGPILARYLYNDLALRQTSCDLDLLVRHETIEKSKEKLAELDYSVCGIEHKRDFLLPANLSSRVSQIAFTKKIDSAANINLDLHWCIRGFFNDKSIQKLWQEARYFDLGDQKILVPSHEDHLIYLSLISISALEFVQLKYLYDMHRLITIFGKELVWERLLDKARQLKLENCLYFPLNLSKILFLTDIPNALLERLRPNWLTRSLINVWINEKSVLSFREKAARSYPLRYLLGRYLYSNSSADFLRKSFRMISN